MPPVYISSYRLRQDKLEEYLKEAFPGTRIEITVRDAPAPIVVVLAHAPPTNSAQIGDGTYDVELPNSLTQGQYDKIDGLRDKRRSRD
ncbi:hypothetical protein F5Y08DRAFT_342420 [Xylaria arbuscula]|uniref:Uncharacterized protein n=1 Tax=Xylaria arbuscula TaxID=114810 RepID=A0A9W8NDZ5_9PEZI|nr:hypothetical protein F5Y08DRAFT_342420 [Xylaria arbuscula]KAJ3570692.1 hypothetical protein NPX13_g5645 [Xylaria arbuscula]